MLIVIVQDRYDKKKETISIAKLYCSLSRAFTLSTLGKIFSRRDIEMFFLFFFFSKKGFDISYKLNPLDTIYLKCQILFPEKNMKNIINLSSAEYAQREW